MHMKVHYVWHRSKRLRKTPKTIATREDMLGRDSNPVRTRIKRANIESPPHHILDRKDRNDPQRLHPHDLAHKVVTGLTNIALVVIAAYNACYGHLHK